MLNDRMQVYIVAVCEETLYLLFNTLLISDHLIGCLWSRDIE
jgi:hypothetical protein